MSHAFIPRPFHLHVPETMSFLIRPRNHLRYLKPTSHFRHVSKQAIQYALPTMMASLPMYRIDQTQDIRIQP